MANLPTTIQQHFYRSYCGTTFETNCNGDVCIEISKEQYNSVLSEQERLYFNTYVNHVPQMEQGATVANVLEYVPDKAFTQQTVIFRTGLMNKYGYRVNVTPDLEFNLFMQKFAIPDFSNIYLNYDFN